MAKLIEVLNQAGGDYPTVFEKALNVKSGTLSSIKAGYLVVRDAANDGFVTFAPDGTDTSFDVAGVAVSDSTETASLDGTVNVINAPILLVKLFAKTPANLTAAMRYKDKYVLDVTGGDYTLDQGVTANGIFRLWDFDNTTDGVCFASIACNLL